MNQKYPVTICVWVSTPSGLYVKTTYGLTVTVGDPPHNGPYTVSTKWDSGFEPNDPTLAKSIEELAEASAVRCFMPYVPEL
jgi:hypothetical protein